MTNTLKTFHATINSTTNHYEMSQNWFNKMIEKLPEGYDWKQNPKNKSMYAITKNGKRIYTIDIVAKTGKVTNDPAKKVVKNETTKKAPAKKDNVSRETIPSGHKSKGGSYIVIFKNKNDKKETKNTDMTTCAEIKAFLKTLSKKQLEYLRIYDEANNECRKSAWVG